MVRKPNAQAKIQIDRYSNNVTIPNDHNQGDEDDSINSTTATDYSHSDIESKIKGDDVVNNSTIFTKVRENNLNMFILKLICFLLIYSSVIGTFYSIIIMNQAPASMGQFETGVDNIKFSNHEIILNSDNDI